MFSIPPHPPQIMKVNQIIFTYGHSTIMLQMITFPAEQVAHQWHVLQDPQKRELMTSLWRWIKTMYQTLREDFLPHDSCG